MKTTREQVQEKIDELRELKENAMRTAQEKLEAASAEKIAAEKAMYDATARLNVDDFETAKAAKQKAEAAIEMYTGRLTQIQKQEYITEAESDQVIDSLLQYENELAIRLEHDLSAVVKRMAELNGKYREEIQAVEMTIVTWTSEIHSNHRNFTGTTYYDPERETRTSRRPGNEPMPIRIAPFLGSPLSDQIDKLLRTEWRKLVENK